MRFRARVGFAPYLWSIAALFYIGAWIAAPHPALFREIVACWWILFAALMIAVRLFTSWDLEADGIRERLLWHTRFVPWSDVSYVGVRQNDTRGPFSIEYTRPVPHSITGQIASPGRLIVDPQKRRQFLDQLRQFAPQAEFET